MDLDSEVGWVPASYLEPRDGSMDDQVLETFEEGEGKVLCYVRSSHLFNACMKYTAAPQ